MLNCGQCFSKYFQQFKFHFRNALLSTSLSTCTVSPHQMLSEASSCLGRDSQGKPGTLLLAPASGPPRGPAITTQHPCPHHQVEVLLPLPKPGLPGHQRNLAVIPNQELDASIFTPMHHSPLGCPSIAPASGNIITAVHPQVLTRTHSFISAPYETMRTC